MTSERRIQSHVLEDLTKKMVWVAGPRQSGKTTLAKEILKSRSGAYYNWDYEKDRKALKAGELREDAGLWILDEIHKNPRWRNWLKGQFDHFRDTHQFLVTGSAKLDTFGRGGDSLQGRYFLYRLHPFTLTESLSSPWAGGIDLIPDIGLDAHAGVSKQLVDLLKLGGFPEPFLGGSHKQAERWRLSYVTRLVREEIRDLTSVRDLDRLESLAERLPELVGSTLSLNSLREDLETSHATVKNWVSLMERMYAVFRIAPYGNARIKAVKKEPKLYCWDWARVENEGARFENLVASHLLRLCHWAEDIEGVKLELRYFRDVHGREVDFVLLKKGKPWMAIEAKLEDRPLDPNMKYFLERTPVPYAFQIARDGQKDFAPAPINGCRVRVMPAGRFLSQLP